MAIEREFDSNFRKVLVAARRARQLQQGSTPMVATRTTKPHKVAQEEIQAGMVGFIKDDSKLNKVAIDPTIIPRFVS